MNVNVASDYEAVSCAVAARIAQLIREKPGAVLGLATGSTPLGVYAELIRMHREEDLDLLKLDEALTELAKLDPRRSRVVELRFFAGLDMKETAEALHVSIATVLRDWNMAKAWLYRYMKDER